MGSEKNYQISVGFRAILKNLTDRLYFPGAAYLQKEPSVVGRTVWALPEVLLRIKVTSDFSVISTLPQTSNLKKIEIFFTYQQNYVSPQLIDLLMKII